MNEKCHAELEQYHFRAMRDDPEYRAQFTADVLWEELMMQMPRFPVPSERQPADVDDLMEQDVTIRRLEQQVAGLRETLSKHIEMTTRAKAGRPKPKNLGRPFRGVEE